MTDNLDKHFIQQAVDLATHSVDMGGGPFGAVIVKDSQEIGRGHNQVTLSNDPTAHAEIIAIRNACQQINNFSLEGSTLYASCQPCPMCLSAIYWARIERVVYAASSEDAAKAGFDDRLIGQEICMPDDKKTLQIQHQSCSEHNLSFEMWLNKSDRTDY